MRTELRRNVGKALKLPIKDHDDLDCVESGDLFMLLKPGAAIERRHFTEAELRPLLRQAIVAIAAAVESYVAAKASTFIPSALSAPPGRLREIQITVGEVLDLERKYPGSYGWRRRAVLERHLQALASCHSSQIGLAFSTVGQRDSWKKVDRHRKVPANTSAHEIDAIARRRDAIAHNGDRKGSGRNPLTVDEVQAFLDTARSIVTAFESVL